MQRKFHFSGPQTFSVVARGKKRQKLRAYTRKYKIQFLGVFVFFRPVYKYKEEKTQYQLLHLAHVFRFILSVILCFFLAGEKGCSKYTRTRVHNSNSKRTDVRAHNK